MLDRTEETAEWDGALRDASEFVASHEGMRVSQTGLSVPRQFRDEFYGIIQKAQNAVVNASCGAMGMQHMATVAELCDGVRKSIVEMSDLQRFVLPEALERFIENPVAMVSAPALSRALDALRMPQSSAELFNRACDEVKGRARMAMRCAYESWVYYGVVAHLEPRRFYEVFSPDTVIAHAMPTGVVQVGEQATSPNNRFPEAVFETADGRCFAMKSEVARELDYYGAKIKRRRDMSLGGNSANYMMHRVLMLYAIPSVDDVPVLANRDKLMIRAADLAVEVLDASDMRPGLSAAMFLGRVDVLNSKRPIQIVTFDETGNFPDEVMADPRAVKFEHTTVGRDISALRAIAGMLSGKAQ